MLFLTHSNIESNVDFSRNKQLFTVNWIHLSRSETNLQQNEIQPWLSCELKKLQITVHHTSAHNLLYKSQ